MNEQKRYDENFKQRVVQEVLNGEITKEEARRRYNIGGKSTVLKWMRTMSGIKANEFGTNPIPILQSMGQDKEEASRLKAEIKRLKAALEHSELKGRAYQIMVEIAKEKYGIDLEKKPGAKQSKNSKRKSRK
jgi:transposase-like protein